MSELDQRTVAQVRGRIAQYGWDVVLAGGEPAMAYSVGFFETFRHPEVVVFGLEDDELAQVINNCGRQIVRGRRFVDNLYSNQVRQGLQCSFRTLKETHLERLAYARAHSGGEPFSALQCLWPDDEGVYPWEDGCAADVVARQPFLF